MFRDRRGGFNVVLRNLTERTVYTNKSLSTELVNVQYEKSAILVFSDGRASEAYTLTTHRVILLESGESIAFPKETVSNTEVVGAGYRNFTITDDTSKFLIRTQPFKDED